MIHAPTIRRLLAEHAASVSAGGRDTSEALVEQLAAWAEALVRAENEACRQVALAEEQYDLSEMARSTTALERVARRVCALTSSGIARAIAARNSRPEEGQS